jgi:hypothetical protein
MSSHGTGDDPRQATVVMTVGVEKKAMTIRPWTGKLLRRYRKEDRQSPGLQARLLDRDGRTSPKESKATGKGTLRR